MKKGDSELKLRKAIGFFFLIIVVVFVVDHIFKFIIAKKGCFLFMCLDYATNTGAAFSLFAGTAWARVLLIIVGVFILVIVAYFYFKTRDRLMLKIAFPLIFGGTISNLLNRLFLGYVVDIFTFSFWHQFPKFNIADVANLVGVILLIVYLLGKNDKRK
ncbi:MAG: signal peptidase II [archaeon]|nr:MAG: signal peptidase II [archaeon]